MSAIAYNFNQLTKKIQTPLFIISQVNPDGITKESGDIEDSASYVIHLEREPTDKIGTLRASKAKNSPIFDGMLEVDTHIMTWRDMV